MFHTDLAFSETEDQTSPGIANLDFPLILVPPLCSVTSEQVAFRTSKINAFNSTTLNLVHASNILKVPDGTPDNIPDGFSGSVFDNPKHVENPVKSTTKNGAFYYFFYDEVFGCCNTVNSIAKLQV